MEERASPTDEKGREELLIPLLNLIDKLDSDESDNYRGQISLTRADLGPVVAAFMNDPGDLIDRKSKDAYIYAEYATSRLEQLGPDSSRGIMVEVSPIEVMCNHILSKI